MQHRITGHLSETGVVMLLNTESGMILFNSLKAAHKACKKIGLSLSDAVFNYRQSTMTYTPNYEGLGFVSSLFAGLQDGCVLSQNVSLRIFICLFLVPSYFLLLLFLSLIKHFVVVKLSKCVKTSHVQVRILI